MYSWIKRSFFLFLLTTLVPVPGFSYEIPRQDSKARFFYIFGPQGNPLDGKEGDEFNLYVDVPVAAQEKVSIHVFDPDTGGAHDQGVSPWNTEMEMSVSGAELLDKQVFASETTYDNKYFTFGPYAKEDGEKVGSYFRFIFKIKALKGDDLNMFSMKVTPDSADAFSDKFTFVLLPGRGDKMYFYPQVPAGISQITVRNYDLDPDGGVSELYDSSARKTYAIHGSESGKWTDTALSMQSDTNRRLEYRVKTTEQTNGHAGIQFLDDKGNVLPIYFRKGPKLAPEPKKKPVPQPAPKAALACNQFVFDARKSYDPEKGNLTYLWNFGDGTTSDEPYVAHLYEKGGNYNVTLTVSDNSGLKCEKSTTTQKVSVNTPPNAALKGPDLVCAGTEVTLDASGSADENSENLSYSWNLGDGTSAEGAQVTKVYQKGGVYNISLTVDDKAGSSCSLDSAKHVVKVNTAPVANAGKPVSVCLRNAKDTFNVVLDGSASYDEDRDQLSYIWDFGDETQGEGAKVSHQYRNAGDYTASLVVSDNSGSHCSGAKASVPVKLYRAPVAVAGKDQSICSGSTVSLDASGSEADESAVYNWDFGDGKTATGKTVEHTYEKGGAYKVLLTVDNGDNTDCSKAMDTLTVFVNSRPTASLNNVEAACSGDKVTLDASSSSDPDGNRLNYIWDFGDGTTWEGGSKVTHQYSKGGTYKVAVTVDDGSGGSCSSAVDTTVVKVNTPPVANAGPNLACCTEDTTPFDGSASSDPDGDSLSYQWSFGDGGSSKEATVEHAYSKSGVYKVALTVDDGSGTRCSASSSSFTANVNSQPVPVIEIKQK